MEPILGPRAKGYKQARFIEKLPTGAVHVKDGALWMNTAAERITGYDRSEITTIEDWFRILYRDTSGHMLSRYEAQRAAGFPKTQHGRIRRKDGKQRFLEFRACSDVIGEIWIIDDITERAAMEARLVEANRRAEVSSRAKSEFLANMTHELRTPLTAIIGFADILKAERCEHPRRQRWIERIAEASRGLLVIVNDVLDFSKLEDNSLSLAPRPFELRPLFVQAIDLLRPQAEKKGLTLDLAIDAAAPKSVSGDADRIRQILLNLVGNAVKFTGEGGVKVTARYAAPNLLVEVRDTGVGIPPEALASIFDRFVQGDGSISRRFGGTGLGLAITKRLAQMMDGDITVESRVGVGSVFRFSAVLPASVERASRAASSVEIAPATGLDGLRVLLAEDVEANQELITTLLTAAGVRVDVVGNGAEAVEAARTGGFDLVLMDVQMPVMGGLEAARRIRALPGEAARVPIVALSANVLPAHVAETRAAGMDGHVGKPIDARALLSAVAAGALAGAGEAAA